MDVFFETQSGGKFSIEVGYFDTVLKIKEKIEKYQRIPVSKQTLIFQGEVLLQDDLNIEQCKIYNNSRLKLFVSPHDQVTKFPTPPNSESIGDIIYGEDTPLTAEHVMNIQLFHPETTEDIVINMQDLPVEVMINDNNEQVVQTEKSPPSNPAEQIINGQDFHVTTTVQVIQSEQPPPPKSVNETTNIQDSPWKPVKVTHVRMKMKVFVMPYSGENEAAMKIPVDVNPNDSVEALRKELVKIQQKGGQLNLPQEGFFFIHRERKMFEDQKFWWNGVKPGDTIEICPGHVTDGS
ncbi:unnamed protein product [Microthlaspi erraticum]|uniref:Ubiquitin-like domain-containing protein n=1 Tax=Microthlaspi erraticum TaxID=1685480 RepID=A0A6D2K161_9BRAS|nr:unnamed protein product [Microthlaspi erraticum]